MSENKRIDNTYHYNTFHYDTSNYDTSNYDTSHNINTIKLKKVNIQDVEKLKHIKISYKEYLQILDS